MPDNKEKTTIEFRQKKRKELLLEQLRKIPIVQIAVERAGVGRTTYYRWREEDKEFAKASDEALLEGEALITDMTESQLISLIKDRNFPSINLWLRVHHPKYAAKVEVTAQINQSGEQLTPEQEAVIREALRLASCSEQLESDSKSNEQEKTGKTDKDTDI